MTEMTVSAPTGAVRLAGLGWNTARQHRLALVGLAIVFTGFGLGLALTGIPLHAAYASTSRTNA